MGDRRNIVPIITWLEKVVKSVLRINSQLDFNFYMHGIEPKSKVSISRATFDRILLVIALAKLTIWKSRNLRIFEGKHLSTGQVMCNILLRKLKLEYSLIVTVTRSVSFINCGQEETHSFKNVTKFSGLFYNILSLCYPYISIYFIDYTSDIYLFVTDVPLSFVL